MRSMAGALPRAAQAHACRTSAGPSGAPGDGHGGVEQVLWLPREDQLRTLLGGRFRRLQAVSDEWVVVATTADGESSFLEPDVESAYASAVLAVLPEVLADALP